MIPGTRGLRAAIIALGLLTGAGADAADPATAQGELRIGAVPMDIPAGMHARLKPLADYLAGELGRPVRLRLSADYSRAVDEITNGSVDIAYLAPAAYLRARQAGGARVIAKTLTRGRATFRLVLVTRADSSIREPRDLIGRSLALGDPSAYLQQAVLLHAGLRLGQLGSYRYVGHFDNIARGVLKGDFDAGIVKDTTAYQWEAQGLRVFYSSPDLPPYNIAVSRRVDDALAQRIQAALLRLRIDDPQHARVIHALDESYDGFVAASEREYEAIRPMVEPFLK